MVILLGGQCDILEGVNAFIIHQRQLSAGVHAYVAALAIQANDFGFSQHFGFHPHLDGEVTLCELVGGVCFRGICPCHGTIGVSEAHGMILCLYIARCGRPSGLHVHIGHRAARRSEGDAAAHRSRGLGKADVRCLVGNLRSVIAFVNHRHAVVVEYARQRCVVGVHQVVLVT